MFLDPASGVIEAFQAGCYFTINTGVKSRTYKLRGTRASLNAVFDCVERHIMFRAPPANTEAGLPPPPPAPTVAEPEKDTPRVSSGSGFLISEEGHILTNAHVVEDCTVTTANGASAQILARSEVFDLALLQADELRGKPFARFSDTPASLNSDVTVAGFPLAGQLGGFNVTRGAVSSRTGLDGDATRMQISAPVQKGNSGGPVLNATGEVVGVVVSKLNALYFAREAGDLPQNVNFAVRGETAKLFLEQNGVSALVVLAP